MKKRHGERIWNKQIDYREESETWEELKHRGDGDEKANYHSNSNKESKGKDDG